MRSAGGKREIEGDQSPRRPSAQFSVIEPLMLSDSIYISLKLITKLRRRKHST